jgi:hypothetical protein
MIAAWETEGDNPDEPASKLPLWRTIKLSYVTYMHHFADALRVTWLWMLLIAGLLAGSDWLRWSWTVRFAERFKAGEIIELGVYPILAVGLSALAFLVVVLASLDIAVAWHRQLILGERPRLGGSTFASRAPWRYLAILVGLILVSAIPVVLIFIVDLLDLEALSDRSLQIVAASVVTVVLGAALSNFVRLSLVLPARAAGDLALTFRESWIMTRGNTWRLLAGTFACWILPYIPLQFLPPSFGEPNFDVLMKEMLTADVRPAGIVIGAIGRQFTLIYQLLTVPISIGFLSYCYRHFVVRI